MKVRLLDQKQLENGEIFKNLGSILTNDRCTCEIKSKIPVMKNAFNKKGALFFFFFLAKST
jgi:hypothetical protein